MTPHAPLCAAVLVALASLPACRKARPEPAPAPAAPAPTTTTQSATLTTRSAELAPRVDTVREHTIEELAVPGDRPALVVVGDRPRSIVYLHGMCSEPRSDLESWGRAVATLGTVVALEGGLPCPGRGGHTFTRDIAALDARIDAALAAVVAERAPTLDTGEVVLVGESLGATRALALAHASPAKYTRLVLVGGPETPAPSSIQDVKAVALLAGEKEPQGKMRRGTELLEGAGVPARFWELPEATHGTYGPDGARAMTEAVRFVLER